MKKLITLLVVITSLLQVSVVDNRDYPEDGYEVYFIDTHIGHIYSDYTFEYSLTGKQL